MGVYSTETLSRSEALQRITKALATATNAELSAALFGLTENRTLSNYTVVNDENYPLTFKCLRCDNLTPPATNLDEANLLATEAGWHWGKALICPRCLIPTNSTTNGNRQ
jgi:hypothetical protein